MFPLKSLLFSPLIVLSLLAVISPLQAETSKVRPNIVMIFTDDQRFDAVGYVGNESIHTPNLDRLAGNGLIFEQCFVNTSICSVSRANLIAGQYPGRHGVDDFFKVFTPKQLEDSVPGRLQAAGYQTAFFGKWGIGDKPEPTHQGAQVFDYWAGQPQQTCFFHEPDCKYVNFDGFERPLDDLCDCPADARGQVGWRNRIGKANLVDPLHMDSEIIPMQVDRFLSGRDEAKPFTLMLFFKAPHSPYEDWDPELKHLTDGIDFSRDTAATLENAQREPEIVRNSLGAPTGMRFVKDDRFYDKHMRDYYRLVASMDLGVGRVMEALAKHGVDENTVVLFTSDNGHFLGEHGLAGKWLMYEPSLRVPGFVYDPRNEPKANRTEAPIITTDFSVTMLALAGLEKPSEMTGANLMQLFCSEPENWRDDVFYDHPYGHGGAIPRTMGVRTDRYVYTRYIDPNPNFEQLFDLANDPDQLVNLANSPEHASLLVQLRNRADELSREVNQ